MLSVGLVWCVVVRVCGVNRCYAWGAFHVGWCVRRAAGQVIGVIMDIFCTRCGEPWEVDTIHDYVSEVRELYGDAAPETFKSVYAAFVSGGCGAAFPEWKVSCEPDRSGRASVFAGLADIMGDDVDGFASLCADFGGLL
jgi:hypothetical protein